MKILLYPILKLLFKIDIDLDQINGGTINTNVQNNGTSIGLSNGSNNNVTQNQGSLTTNKLPLFDYYSCHLRLLPTTSYI